MSETAPPSPRKIPVVGVMGSGASEWTDLCTALGELLASMGVHLLTGGGKGVMTSVSRAFSQVTNRQGLVLGVIPGNTLSDGTVKSPDGYPNPYVELPIYTHLPFSGLQGSDALSRNHINILSSDVIIALPGSSGTCSEVMLALRYKKPILLYLGESGDISGLDVQTMPLARSIEEVKLFLQGHLI